MAGIKHTFVTGKVDGTDTSALRPSDWNAAHSIEDGTIASFTALASLSASDILWVEDVSSSNAKRKITASQVLSLIAPIGGIIMFEGTDAEVTAIEAGGIWARMTSMNDRFPVGATGDNGTIPTSTIAGAAATTGGAATHTHTGPSHFHSVGAHAHGLNSHTHTIDHSHSAAYTEQVYYVAGAYVNRDSGGAAAYTPSITHYHRFTPASHSGSSGGASGNTADSSAFDTGNSGTGNTGNASAAPSFKALWFLKRVA